MATTRATELGQLAKLVTVDSGGNSIISGTIDVTLPPSGVVAGTHGSATNVPIMSVTAQGIIDSVGSAPITSTDSFDFDSATGQLTIGFNDGSNLSQTVTLDPFTSDNLVEGSNLYYTQARFDSALGDKSTTDVSEGSNLYYTQARARGVLVAGNNIGYDSATGVISFTGTLDHDSLTNYVANEHIDHTAVSISAGSGLTGGGNIAATRTINVGQGTGITVTADAISTNDAEIVHDDLSGFVANEHIDHTTVSVTAGSGLTGGGTIAANRTINVGAGSYINVGTNDISVDATHLNTASKVVARNSSGNFSAGTITADLVGNASTADELSTPRTISLSGDVTGSTSFDGSGNVSITATVVDDGHNHVISNVDGLQTALDGKLASSLKGANNGLAELDGSGKVPSGQLPSFVDDVLEYADENSFPGTGETSKLYVALDTNDVYRWSGSAYVKVSDAVSTADQATQLATARTIALTGDVSGSTSFDGSGNVSITTTVADDSHNHTISNVDGLQTALDGKVTTSRTISAGNGLTGGGNLTANRTLNVGAGTGVTVNADTVAIGQDVGTSSNVTFNEITANGDLTIANNDPVLSINDTNNGSGGGFIGHIAFNNTSGESFRIGDWAAVNETGGPDILRLRNSNGTRTVFEWGQAGTTAGSLYAYNQRVFADDYHPNADKWTTARTLSLSGDASGSVSWDGSSNATLSVTVADDSHNHDGRYYTETEADSRFVNVTGDTMSGNLSSTAFIGTTQSATAPSAEDARFDGFGVQGNRASNALYVHNYGNGGVRISSNANLGTANGILVKDTETVVSGTLKVETNTAFHDGYHPNADKWTTARTLSLSGDASGSVSWDGSGNASISVTVADDSHSHSNYITSNADDTGTGGYSTSGTYWEVGNGTGSVAINTNDGYGNANLTFNHHEGRPDISGNAARIEVNVDSPSGASMNFEVKSSVTGGTTVQTSSILNLSESQVTAYTTLYENGNRVFNDGYHPNADKWTTARTLSLSGDASGSVSWDGSANATLSVTVANDSHTHDGRYYTETEADSRFVNASGDTMSGRLNISYASSLGLNIQNTSNAGWAGIEFSDHAVGSYAQKAYLQMSHSDANSPGSAYGATFKFSTTESALAVVNTGEYFAGSTNRVFHDGYHPNADKWTTARTLSLSGDASGSVSWDGSANATLSVTVANDSHNHSSSSGNFTVNGILFTDHIDARTSQDLTITCGEMGDSLNAGSYNDEVVRIGGEGGVKVYASSSNGGPDRETTLIDTSGNMTINGTLSATTKSFVIDHPTKPGMKLRHGSLEGPEDGVYVRGKLKGNNVIELPDYWTGLVHEDSITVQLTAIGKGQDIWVEDIADNKVIVGGDNINCFYLIQAERKDVERWDVEYEA